MEIEIGDDCSGERAGEMFANREFETGKNLLGRGDAADHEPALQDQDFLSGLGKIRRADKAVMAGADDDRVVALHGGLNPFPVF